jgi:hypothetical protein
MRENKSSGTKTQNKGQSKALYSTVDFSKVDPLYMRQSVSFYREVDGLLHPEDTLVRKGSKQNVLGYFWKVSD